LDFYCPKLLLTIEIDGDFSRKKLSAVGIKTIRYTTDEIIKNLFSVISNLKIQIQNRNDEL